MVAKKSQRIGLLVSLVVVIVVAVLALGEKRAPSAGSSETASSSSALSSGETVWVTRPDGAHQCAPGSGESLNASAQELKKAKVRVLESLAEKGSDKKMHAQMCGIASGTTNMFEIPKEDLPKAIVLGFHQVNR